MTNADTNTCKLSAGITEWQCHEYVWNWHVYTVYIPSVGYPNCLQSNLIALVFE